ncbi:Ran GTPase-binding protein MOG1 NDAI_0A03790 [Naumovozyma dairenensis CBS 421]|uniref:Uncharacterized protein n=1 Tax=Naumovozyma dairenensis (strain ATCC 10597 / BCRC 20456 / CBS 421 / NBRC 0211 / NRRL Y-12639) TaxID=1071378 RepID=G0W3Z8_NAUDC|nr:hypothetical protein NDAI_0A03790 [Naumovozyma dairenensis CBS 421]CCD22536.1 hypothetical protein NDAI_0A03790 [Naumovozyma dairenensis CBS 421]
MSNSSNTSNTPVETPLYGGAITTVIPQGFLDVSMLREVPDTQEVYVNNRSTETQPYNDGLANDESIIIDLLQAVPESNDLDALKLHIEDIVSLNNTTTNNNNSNNNNNETVQKDDTTAPTPAPYQILNIQTDISNTYLGTNCISCIVVESATKWGKQEMKETLITCIGLIRLKEVETDVIITINVPTTEETTTTTTTTIDPNKNLPTNVKASSLLLKQMLSQFKVIDKSLFV